jgi:xanthine dehydrogenase YagT iron-sulfur-binding subunit
MEKERKEKVTRTGRGLSRRGFMASVGAGAAAVAAASQVAATPTQEIKSAGEMVEVVLDVNGRRRKVLVEPRWTLLYVLRDVFGLTATKPGCERGECGACTVLIDDLPRYSCMTLAVEAEGHTITTLEGLMDGEKLGVVQQAFAEEDAFQCGFCTPGQIVAVEGLLRANPEPSLDEIRMGVSGNLCRCGAYQNIFRAAKKASDLKWKGGV